MEQLGLVVCNRHEEVWISLKEVRQEWHIELRVYERSDDGGRQPRPGRDVINLPVEQLPLLLERLAQAKDSCLRRGLLWVSGDGHVAPVGRAATAVQPDRARAAGMRARLHPRLPVRYAVLCQPMVVGEVQRSAVLRGEFRDLSVGGAQLWLPSRLNLAQQVEIGAMIEGQAFRAKAEIVGADLRSKGDPETRCIRHSLKWITYNSAAADVLTLTLLQLDVASPTADRASGAGPSGEPAGFFGGAEGRGERPPAHPGAETPGAAGCSREIGRPLGYMVTSGAAWEAMR
jgi:hypothetical protein